MLTRSLLQFETANLDTAWVTVLQAADAIPEKTEQAADDIAALLTVAARLAWFSGEIARLEQARDRILALPGPPNSLRRRLALSMVGLFLLPGHVPPRGFLAAALETFGSPVGSPWMWPPGLCAAAVGEDSAALQLYSREVASLRAAGSIGELAQALVGLGYAESYLGLWSNAVVHASEGLRLSRETDQPGGTGLCLGLLARIAGAQGRADDCRRYTAEALDRVTTQGSIAVVSVTRWGLGQLALGLGDPEEAYAQLSAIASPERWPDGNVFAPISALDLVEAAILAGRREDAFSTLEAMHNLTRGFGLAWAELVTERSLALLSDGPDAEEHFRAALDVPGAELRRFEFARTQLVFGEWLRRNRRRAEARRFLRSSLEAFTASAAGPWAKRAQSELRASGARTEQGGQVALEALTPQELQVVRLAARGLSNREIGTQLFLSPRTVGFHLYKAYPKLGVASRSELTRLQLEESDLTEARSG
jgi:DNA-binding CsgD family transcriptional regulator